MKESLLSAFTGIEKHPRRSSFYNLLIMAVQGGSLGATSAGSILAINTVLIPPWTYLLAASISLAAKVVLSWLSALIWAPLASDVAARSVEQRTGIAIPSHQRPRTNHESSTSIVTVAMTVTIASYLTSIGAGDSQQIGNLSTFFITVGTGAIVAVAESLSRRTIIVSLWHNRTEYQDSPAYQQTAPQSQRTTTSRQKPSCPNPKRQNKKNRRKAGRR